MRGLLIRLGIIGVVVAGAFVLRPYLTGNAGSLAVGDCFDEPDTAAETVKDVQHRPCTDPHDAEVFYVGNYEPSTGTYPSDTEFFDFIVDRCSGAFATYTGRDLSSAEDLDFRPFWPTSEGWDKGERRVTCYVVNFDGTKLNVSIKKAA